MPAAEKPSVLWSHIESVVTPHVQVTACEEQGSSVCHGAIQRRGDCVRAAATPSHGAIPAQTLRV